MSEQNKKSQSALREEAVLQFWKENKIFEKSLNKKSPKGEFVFFEGPPTANGKPGIHHLEARAFKDAIPRYKTMRGYHVRRKGGWDTHGLPVELQVEKQLGLTSKKDIEEYGIAKFNTECKKSVWKYLEYWNKFTERIGFWVDQENPYVTYHNNYIESVWNVIKETSNQNLLFKDYKVVPWCPRCGTALSSHELAQGYEDVKDLSVYVKFKVKDQENTFILAWTTTPWTLPGNVALAVGENIDYVKIKKEDSILILAKTRLAVIEGEYEILEEMKGKDLIGLEYEPLYPFLKEQIEGKDKNLEKAFKVYSANFVTTEDGTGVVHTAVMYGQDDFMLGTEIGLPKHHLVGLDGKFLPGTGFLEGRFVRDEEVAVDVIKDLAHRNLLFKKEKYEHSYPHCWRCKTALIYYARDSWYIRMSDPKIKNKMIEENKSINWEPEHIREGRFGEWLREIKDWAISRERYWGSPLPVWHCDKCNKIEVIGSIEDLKKKAKKSGNRYFVARHGQALSNIKGISNYKFDPENKLTDIGENQVRESAEKIKDKKIDFVFSSSLPRTKRTAEIICEVVGFDKNKISFDDRLLEFNTGDYEGKTTEDFHNFIRSHADYLEAKFPNGESPRDLFVRMGNFIYDIESKYSDKNILIVSHGDPIMDLFLLSGGYEKSKIVELEKNFAYLKNAEIRELDFVPLPHNENYELDLHRPYIDEVELVCDHAEGGQACGGKLVRTKEVMDVWLDSGTMPFSQDHYPFENKNLKYPADFISEAIDQTRGWFYTLHAVGTLMGRGKAYKNVICLGHLLDAKGKKMSKSLGNIVDPWEMMDKYGVDTLRLWMYAVNQPGESKNFDEKTVMELHNKVFNLLYNVLTFYELYRDKELEKQKYVASKNVLDKWIVARLNQLSGSMTENLDNYKLLEPVRAIREFIDDLSTWYLRRSRERIKDGDTEAKQTLYYVLKNLAKLMAPFAPFAAEDVWQKLKTESDEESVHLASWPKVGNMFSKLLSLFNKKDKKIISEMQKVRETVTLGLQARQKAGIPVRQPLSKLSVKNYDLNSEYTELIKDEVNVREVVEDKNIETEVLLNTEISVELKEEGNLRELIRAIQDMRKKAGLVSSDVVVLNIETDQAGQNLVNKFKDELLKTVNAREINFAQNSGEEIKIDNLSFKIAIQK
ncbi:MAG TPA: class I tRNA ligase family protein [Candidatus Paceibacterota bacterium]|nr:class I tRNA ligase family protein [Candidatus Paceibacterota bacterium]